MPMARQRSSARPVASCSTAKLELMPAPERKLRRTEVPRAFGRDHDHIHVLRRDDAGLFLVGDGETVREVERVAGLQVRLDRSARWCAGRRRTRASG